jgi:hypothetical protein
MADLIGCQTTLKKASTHKNKDIPGNIATPGNDVPQISRTVNLPTYPAVVQGLMGFKRTGHAKHSFPSGFLDKKSLATGTAVLFGPEPYGRRLREQCFRQCIVI